MNPDEPKEFTRGIRKGRLWLHMLCSGCRLRQRPELTLLQGLFENLENYSEPPTIQ